MCSAFGYRAERIIDDSRPGEITSQIVAAIYQAELVVADITAINGGPNANVMYELALRHASGKPFIHLAEGDSPLPFDISGLNTIAIDRSSFGGMEATRRELEKHVRAVKDGQATFDNPVSRYHEQERVAETGEPLAQMVATLREEVSELRTGMRRLQPLRSRVIEDLARVLNGNFPPPPTHFAAQLLSEPE